MNTQPVFIFNRLNMSTVQIQDLLFRLNRYGEEWLVSHPNSLVVFLPKNKSILTLLENLNFPYLNISLIGKNPMINTFLPFQVLKYFRLKDSRFTLICGDLLLAPLTAFIVKFFCPFRVRSQISLHGDPRIAWGSSPSGITKRVLLRFAFKTTQSVRVVSNQLKNDLCDVKGLIHLQIVVAPIPSVPPVSLRRPTSQETIGFVGRLHEERNTDEWVEIVEKLLNVDSDYTAVVIGAGSNLISMRERLSLFLDERLYFEGELNKEELDEYWNQISILLSPAKQEGFGLAIREALIRGVFVIARRNAGTEYLVERMKGIYLYDSVSEAVELARKLKDKEFLESDLKLNLDFLNLENTESLSVLIASWEFN